MSISIALAAGGTGGHLLPALAVAEALRDRRPEVQLTVIGSGRETESDLLRERGIELATTDAISFASRMEIPRSALRLTKAVAQAVKVLKRTGAHAVCGFGGYPSLAPMLAAALLRKPRLAHEANAIPALGLANRVAAKAGAEVWGGFATTGVATNHKVHHLGIPIRKEIADLNLAGRRSDARARFGLHAASKVILVIGGSLGAKSINAAVSEALRSGLPSGAQLLWSTGYAHHQEMVSQFPGASDAVVLPFIEDMPLAYAAADVVVSRGGASTLAEIEHLGLRAVVIPLEAARLKEQHLNAGVFAERGGTAILEETNLSAPALMQKVNELLSAPSPPPDSRHGRTAALLADRLISMIEKK